MHASPESIFSYFNCGLRQYLVPLFQRPYTWQRPQWLALWEDLARFWETDSRNSAERHFMGAIVTTTARSVPVGVSKFLVIDGQQRLTTIAALLCAIRDQLGEADSVRRRIQESYLTNASYSGLDFFKLLPTQDDRPAYSRLIEGLDVRGLNTPFIKAYEFFCKRLKKGAPDGVQPSPLDVLDVIERRLMVVMVNLGENDDPNLIFESLNFKGAQGGTGEYLIGAFSKEHGREGRNAPMPSWARRTLRPVSIEHGERPNARFWFSFAQDGIEMLYRARAGWFCLECDSPRQVLVIPTLVIRPIQGQMSTSKEGRLHFDVLQRGRQFWLRLRGGVAGPELTSCLVTNEENALAN